MKKDLAFVVGVTPDIAFAAGTMLLGLRRHMAGYDYDILVIQEGFTGQDAELLKSFPNCRFIDYSPKFPVGSSAPPGYPMCYCYRFEMFRMLEEYRTVIWLDCDTAIQGDLGPLALFGPISMGPNDCSFLVDGDKASLTSGRNFREPIPGYDMGAPLYNSGVLVVQDALPRPGKFYDWCMAKFSELHPVLYHFDQGVLNLLALQFPEFFQAFPEHIFNCYPLNERSGSARIVHSFGAQKFWNNGLMNLAFPEWRRDYLHWLELGGSAYTGPVLNSALLDRSAYSMLARMIDMLNQALEA